LWNELRCVIKIQGFVYLVERVLYYMDLLLVYTSGKENGKREREREKENSLRIF